MLIEVISSAQQIPQQAVQTAPSFSLLDIISTVGIFSVLGMFVYIGRKLQTLDNLDNSVKKIKTNLSIVSTYLTKHHTKFNPSELQTFSPFKLTVEGEQFIKDGGFDNVFKANKLDFYNI
ncbi:MAG: hypothetical protein WC860_09490, partial [Candidatus Margulisiibacteriota bacterium]